MTVSLDAGQYSRLRDFLSGEGEWEGDDSPCDMLQLTEAADGSEDVLVEAWSSGYLGEQFVLLADEDL